MRWSALLDLKPLGVVVWRQSVIKGEDVVGGADELLEVTRMMALVLCDRVSLVVDGEWL